MKHVVQTRRPTRSRIVVRIARLAVVLVAAAGSVGCISRRIPDGPPLQIHQELFGSDKFTYNSAEEKPVWDWFQLDPAFASTLERHPTALEEARKAKPFRTGYWIGFAGWAVFIVKAVHTVLSSSDGLTSSDEESARGDVAISLGFSFGAWAFGAFARRYVNRAVSLFNVEEMRSAEGVRDLELGPAYLPGRGAGLVGRLPLR